ncbi:MAG: hypothetical protein F9B45_09795 [Phycisphaera sp. RhM]|nr:hypothetical protein [Phycisphaera sp. RhM]
MSKTIHPAHIDAAEITQQQADIAAMGVYFTRSELVAGLTDQQHSIIVEQFANAAGLTRPQMTDLSLLASQAGYESGELAIEFPNDVVGRYPVDQPSEQYRSLQDELMTAFGAGGPTDEQLTSCFATDE